MLRSTLRRLAAVAALAFAALGGPAAGAASAHTVGGSGASNYVTTIGPLTPAVPGLTLKVVENGFWIADHTGAKIFIHNKMINGRALYRRLAERHPLE